MSTLISKDVHVTHMMKRYNTIGLHTLCQSTLGNLYGNASHYFLYKAPLHIIILSNTDQMLSN